jgi:hypothetical protein
MKWLLWLSILLLPSIALAHPADNICSRWRGRLDPRFDQGGFVGGKFIGTLEICQEPMGRLGFKDFEFYSLWRSYWHERRRLADCFHHMAECRGALNVFQYLRGVPLSFNDGRDDFDVTSEDGPFQTQLDYWNVLPASPIKDIGLWWQQGTVSKAHAFAVARAHLEAAKAGVRTCQLYLSFCSAIQLGNRLSPRQCRR